MSYNEFISNVSVFKKEKMNWKWKKKSKWQLPSFWPFSKENIDQATLPSCVSAILTALQKQNSLCNVACLLRLFKFALLYSCFLFLSHSHTLYLSLSLSTSTSLSLWMIVPWLLYDVPSLYLSFPLISTNINLAQYYQCQFCINNKILVRY